MDCFGKESRQVRRGAALLAWLVVVLCASALGAPSVQAADPVIAAAGDIACAPSDGSFKGGNGTADACRQKYTSDLLVNAGFQTVLALGDNQYDSGSLSDFQRSYDLSWGRVKSITRPVLGNHENSGSGHFDYYNGTGKTNGPAGERGKGYYAYDVGAWRLYALNSNCDRVACTAGSAQEQWLRADLAANPRTCKLAYMHHARFSSGHDGDNTFVQPLWQALYEAQVDVVLAGHSHNYERFKPMDPSGQADQTRGIRSFVIGTGGAFFTGVGSARPNSEVRRNDTYGVLELTLNPTSYRWQFVPEAGKTFTDSGSESCSGGAPLPGDSEAPSAPSNLSATTPSLTRVDLSWGASSDNVGVTGYEIYRGGALIASTTGTSYTDSTVTAGTTYTYQVRARDAAGNRSVFSNSRTVTTPGTTLRLPAQADAPVEQGNPSSNLATANLRADGGSDPDIASYLRFNVIGVSGTVESAKLRVYALSGTADGPAVQSTTSDWSETGITWNNRPTPTSATTDDKGAIATNSRVEFNVKPFVTGSGTYSFILAPTSNDGVDFGSREHTDPSRRPELLLSVTDTLVDNGVPPDTAITAGPTGATNSASASFAFSSSESPAAFECRLDSAGWTGCSSPKTYTGLAKGGHTFRVRASDQFGNIDATEATRTWTVVFLPQASFGFSPPAPLVNEPVTFTSTSTLVGTDTIMKNEWDLDGNGSFETSTGANPSATRSYPVAGTNVVGLRVTDNDGDTSVATRPVSISLLPPPPPLLAGPPSPPSVIAADRLAPRLTLGGAASQRLRGRRLRVGARCDEPCSVTASAFVSVRQASAVFRTGKLTRSLAAGTSAELELEFSKKGARAIRRALARRRLSAVVKVISRDMAGNLSVAKRRIRLRR
jgi:chitodextrinase